MKSASGSRTSATLLGRLRQDATDQQAWGEFVTRYSPRIYSWCRHWKLQEADAEDVTQNVLVTLAQKMASFAYDPARSFRGWLRTITEHALSDFLASRQRAVLGSGDFQVEEMLHTLEARIDLLSRLDTEFDRELLEGAWARVQLRVEPQTWEAFRLTAQDGQSGADTARQLGLQVTAVFKARSRVQRMLQEELRKLEEPQAV
jgi:RNA polymerase sigma-70 factor (ECF subfamily)